MRRLGWVGASLALGCSTVTDGPGPSEEGMYSDEVGIEVDGVLVQCGNLLDANFYWRVHADGPEQVRVMPVICVGSQDTLGFDLDSAQPIDGKYQFPDWETEIRMKCAANCLDAHETGADQEPVCVEEDFTPNLTWSDWTPSYGPNCDSTIMPNVESEPGLDVKTDGGRS